MRLRLAILLLAVGLGALGQSATADIRPSPQQLAWQDLDFGVIIHFGLNTFLNQEVGDGTASPAVFNPSRFDPDQWMQAIRTAGAKYVIFVAKHHDGFCLWPTAYTGYSVKASPWDGGHGDVVGAVEGAARRAGLKSLALGPARSALPRRPSLRPALPRRDGRAHLALRQPGGVVAGWRRQRRARLRL
jgi:alpha-L-fucosidase